MSLLKYRYYRYRFPIKPINTNNIGLFLFYLMKSTTLYRIIRAKISISSYRICLANRIGISWSKGYKYNDFVVEKKSINGEQWLQRPHWMSVWDED